MTVQERVVADADLLAGVTRKWYVSLGGYLWYVDERFGERTCSCPLHKGCVHVQTVEEQCIRQHDGKTPTPKSTAPSA